MYKILSLCLLLVGCQADPLCGQPFFNGKIANKPVILEVACGDKVSKGLMYRKELVDNQGMIFVFSEEQHLSFWMKNTSLPLSIAFLDKDKKIVDIQDLEPFELKPVISRKKAKYAIEMNRGWYHDIAIGAVLNF